MKEKKKIAIIIVLVAIFIFLIADEQINKERRKVIEIIKSEIRDSEILTNPVYEDNCEICPSEECKKLNISCWKVRINESGIEKEVAVSTDGGGAGKEGGRIIESYPACSDCCVYTYVFQTDGTTITTYNTGCDNPTPSCDKNLNECRACMSKEDCLRNTVYVYDYTPYRFFEYEVIGTDMHGNYIETNQKCNLFVGDENIYSANTTEDACRNEIISRIVCDAGICKYV